MTLGAVVGASRITSAVWQPLLTGSGTYTQPISCRTRIRAVAAVLPAVEAMAAVRAADVPIGHFLGLSEAS
jgi:hypothetical protein